MHLPNREHQSSGFKELVALFRDTSIFFAIITYFVGWVYLNEYLKTFGLYLANLNIPFHYVFVFSYAPLFDPIYNPTWQTTPKLAILWILILGCFVLYRVMRPALGYPVILILFFLVFVISFQVARQTGEDHGKHVLEGGGQPIRFVFNSDVTDVAEELFVPGLMLVNEQTSDICLRFVWQTKEDVYVVDSKCSEGKPTYRIPVSSISFTEIIRKPEPEEER